MIIDIKVPSPGESVTEVNISRWLKKDGEYVEKDEGIAEIDSDKATLTVVAEDSGVLKTLIKEGDTVKAGSLIATIDTDAKPAVKTAEPETPPPAKKTGQAKIKKEEEKAETEIRGSSTPLAKKIMQESRISPDEISGSGAGGKILRSDVLKAMSKGFKEQKQNGSERAVERKKMSAFRKKLAQRLVAVKNETAMLTTFNEVDMSRIIEFRAKYNPVMEKQFGVKPGFVSFFSKAACEALQLFPAVNAMIEGDEIVYHNYCDIGIAVSAPKGLLVPVIRNAEKLSLVETEMRIKELAAKARDNKLSIEDMEGGTFTISNGGVFGSMLSTPIINPPQCAILGLHNIVERPVAINGQVLIRPVMYLALSYDHRIIDGRESVSFLLKIKEMCEDPLRMLFGGKDPGEVLMGL